MKYIRYCGKLNGHCTKLIAYCEKLTPNIPSTMGYHIIIIISVYSFTAFFHARSGAAFPRKPCDMDVADWREAWMPICAMPGASVTGCSEQIE